MSTDFSDPKSPIKKKIKIKNKKARQLAMNRIYITTTDIIQKYGDRFLGAEPFVRAEEKLL